MSSPSDSTLAGLQQTIDDLRRQLVERTAERDAALQRETAAAEVLGVINSSPGDLAPVFDAILEKATSLCEASFGVLSRIDGDQFRGIAFHGAPPAFAEVMHEPQKVTEGNAHYRLINGEDVVHVEDVAAEEAYRTGNPARRALADLAGARTVLWVALRKDATPVGAFVIFRREVRPFSEKQIALLQNFAAQAVIAMENARLITETREALEQQTATAEVLGVINSSPGDLAPVFDAMLEKAIRLCDATQGVLWTIDGDRPKIAATHQVPSDFVELLRQVERDQRVPGGQFLQRIMHGERIVHVADVAGNELHLAGDPVVRASVERGRVRTLIWVALVKDNAAVGAFALARRAVRPFTDKQIALLQNFAAQAVIAMENARLITETREALEQQTATAEVLGVINSSPGDLAPVFDAMLDKARALCGIEFGSLQLFDGENFRAVALRGPRDLPAAFADRLRQGYRAADSPAMRPLLDGSRFVQIPDLAEIDHPLARAAVERAGMHTLLCVPLRREDALLGAIVAARQEVRPFTDKQIALLRNFAAQAVIAMENARLITETREALDQQTATAEVLGVINSSPGNLAPVFDAIVEKAQVLCGAELGTLWKFDGERFHPAAGRSLGAPTAPEGPTPLGRLIAGESIVHIIDAVADPGVQSSPIARARTAAAGSRSGLAVALRKDGALLGAITTGRKRVEPYSDKQIALLQNFAAQAVIAMENARLITETREALAQQTATAEVLGVINSSPGDLAPVFDAILAKAHTLCGIDHGALQLYDGEYFRAVATHGLPESFAEMVRAPTRPAAGELRARLLTGERFACAADLAQSEGYRAGAPTARAAVEIGGVRTVLWVPLRKESVLLGAISAARTEVRPFTDKEIALLESFAAQAVIAIENARLLGELRQRTDEVAELNRGLEARVAEQVEELGRVGRLKRFLAPQLAELIVSQGDEKVLESHRREIVVVFCDLRGYTAFTETAEPEEVLDFLREYHGALGPLVSQFEGTLDQFSGDGIMVFFNDPVPIPDPAVRAVSMAVAMRESAGTLIADWRERGRDLGFGAGIAQGYATLGQIGFSERSGYTAIGTVCNVAARLCAEARDGQILLGQRVNVALRGSIATEQIGALALKGLTQPVVAYNVPLAAAQPRLRVIEGGPESV